MVNSNNKLRVLQGIRQGKIGGGENMLLNIVEHINKEEFEPVVLSFTDGPMVDKIREMNIPAHVIYTEKPFDFTVWKKVQQLMVDEKIDLIHAHGTRACSNLFKPAKKINLPLIYTCHGWSFHPDQNFIVKNLRIQAEKFLTRKATLNVCGAFSNRDTGKALFGNEFNPAIIQNTIDTQRFNPELSFKNLRKEFNIPENVVLFASIARFTVQKQPLNLIKAFAEASKKVDNIMLLMVGDGELKKEGILWIEKLGIQDKVVLTSFRQDVPDVLSNIDVFLLPSLWEVLPLALMEAMAMRKAVVVSRVDGTTEIVENNINGLLIENEAMVPNLSRAIISLAKSKELRTHLGEEAYNSMHKHHSVKEMVKAYEDLYLQFKK